MPIIDKNVCHNSILHRNEKSINGIKYFNEYYFGAPPLGALCGHTSRTTRTTVLVEMSMVKCAEGKFDGRCQYQNVSIPRKWVCDFLATVASQNRPASPKVQRGKSLNLEN